MIEKRFEICSIEGLSEVSDHLLELVPEANVVLFYGGMGAGKTTLIKNLCKKLTVTDEVNSPTFAIVNEYITENNEPIYHFDFYRIKRLEEAFDIGYENYFYSDYLCLVEWPEMIEPILPESYVKVEIIQGKTDNERVVTCSLVTSNKR